MSINLAHISPNQNAYSETFILNHKKHFDANVYFYYSGYLPTHLEGLGYLKPSKFEKIGSYLNHFFRLKNKLSLQENALLKSFKKNKINLVYAEYGVTGVNVLRVCEKLDLPLIVNFHGFDASITAILAEYKEGYLAIFRYASKIIAVSKAMEQKLVELGCPSHKLAYITYGPSTIFFDIKPQYSENSFLAIGRFVEKKAPYYTILAFCKVVSKYPNAKLYMAGDGALFNACNNIVNYLKLENNVIFLGKMDQKGMLPYFEKVKGFVQHSITAADGDMEGTPVAVIEASAAGLPVISTRHAGIPDVIIEGETGLLVEEHDVDGMAENMIRVLDNPDLMLSLGKAGRENITKNFSMELHMKAINKLIHESVK